MLVGADVLAVVVSAEVVFDAAVVVRAGLVATGVMDADVNNGIVVAVDVALRVIDSTGLVVDAVVIVREGVAVAAGVVKEYLVVSVVVVATVVV